ncbi:hypothetical protein Fmac_028130 [Flemingia macrophylla]|uniref:Uncharacterized protein n=1 Tax=Flemingia macrophylla TaxID=520843 RepID=A0ABD1LJV6_9FABA
MLDKNKMLWSDNFSGRDPNLLHLRVSVVLSNIQEEYTHISFTLINTQTSTKYLTFVCFLMLTFYVISNLSPPPILLDLKMAFSSVIAVFAFLLLHPLSAKSDFLSPLLAPIFDDVCKEVECGKGTCKPSKNSTFFFECDCDSGWKQALSDDDTGLKFLPCIVPNCTLDYTCSKAPAPVQDKATKSNGSILDVCRWVDCGGGSCNSTSMFSYNCECDAGYYNLLNVTAFPCFMECSIGMGCSELGISIKNSSTSAPPPPALNDNSKSGESSILQGSSLWPVLIVMFMTKLQLQ